jgi:hypothetical protein
MRQPTNPVILVETLARDSRSIQFCEKGSSDLDAIRRRLAGRTRFLLRH